MTLADAPDPSHARRVKPRHVFALMLSASSTLTSIESLAQSQGCEEGTRPWVHVNFISGNWTEEFRRRVLADLQTSLGEREINACSEAPAHAAPALATVTLNPSAGTQIAVTVEVSDAVTSKRVQRDVTLNQVPYDGQALALAVATDELLWATWAELALEPKTTTQARVTAPRVVTAGIQASTRPEPRALVPTLNAAASAQSFSGGTDWLGGDLALGLQLANLPLRPELSLAPGLRTSFSRSSEHGSVTCRAAVLGVALRVALWRPGAFDVGLRLTERTAFIVYRGVPNETAEGSTLEGLAAELSLHADIRWWLAERAFVAVVAGGGFSLRSLQAEDGATSVASTRGYSGQLGLELGFAL